MNWRNFTHEELIRELEHRANQSQGPVTFSQDQVQHLVKLLQEDLLERNEEISALEQENERLEDRVGELEDELENL